MADIIYQQTGTHTINDSEGNIVEYKDFKWRMKQYQFTKPTKPGTPSDVRDYYFIVEVWEILGVRSFFYKGTIDDGTGKYNEQDFEAMLMALHSEFAGSTPIV